MKFAALETKTEPIYLKVFPNTFLVYSQVQQIFFEFLIHFKNQSINLSVPGLSCSM